MKLRGFLGVFAIAFLLGIGNGRAVLVQDLGIRTGKSTTVSIAGLYTGPIEAGIKSLVVDGVHMDGICIDPFHLELASSAGYSFVPLAGAPKPPGTMDAIEAAEITDLWAMFYSPSITAKNAAGLQLAIWEIVGGTSFSILGSDYGAAAMLASLSGYSGTGASLIALSGPGQDYAVPLPPSRHEEIPPLPEGGSTSLLFGFAIAALVAIHCVRSSRLVPVQSW